MAEIIPFPRRAAPEQSAAPEQARESEQPEQPAGPAVEPLWRETVGEVFRGIRQARGERLADVARRSGVSVQYLSEVERGRKEPSSEMVAAIAGAYELSLLDLTLAVAGRLAPPASGAVLNAA